ncbi:MAG: CRISPR-associated helicase Cas3' [Tissierellia bacterium]|nr:CRISPR-associated helicase Cas3' [Tissierellia bacterium]
MIFYARKDDSGKKQLLKDHIEGVRSRCLLSDVKGFDSTLELIAILHDMGKYQEKWQEYMLGSLQKKVPHSTFGMKALLEMVSGYLKKRSEAYLLRDVGTYVVGAHHGLYDNLTLDGYWNLKEKINRVDKRKQDYLAGKEDFLKEWDEDYIHTLVSKSLDEMKVYFESLPKKTSDMDKKIHLFYHGLLTRILLSVVMDSDWSDAASFFDPKEREWKEYLKDFSWEEAMENLEKKLATFQANSRLNECRKEISDECLESSSRNHGIYKLNVPTGGAKTLASMRFALHHAIKHKKKRILYLAPYKSILIQNAKEYKDILFQEDDKRELYILEHHSDIILENISDEDSEFKNQKELNEKKAYLMENWDAPIIVTTVVQFLNTLFSGKKQSIRRFHKLAESVIIIDEFQAIPTNSIALLNMALNFLSKYFGVTIVLTTATQPPFDMNIESIPKLEYERNPDLVKNYSKDPGFLRTKIIDRRDGLERNEEDMADLIEERMDTLDSLLVIVNTRDAASSIYRSVKNRNPNFEIHLLSNNMVPEHRSDVLKDVKKLLKNERIVLISTQLIEAGVDISFQGVIRSLAGLDSIAQAGGRCNRNGEMDIGEVWIVTLSSKLEKTNKIDDIKIAKETMSALLNDFQKNPEKYDVDLLSEKALTFYFKEYYKKINEKIEGRIRDKKEISIVDLLSSNINGLMQYKENTGRGEYPTTIPQGFKTAGEWYQPIEDRMISVLVDYKGGKDLIEELNSAEGIFKVKSILRKASRYSVQVPIYKFNQLKEDGKIFEVHEVPVLVEGVYKKDIGLDMEEPEEPNSFIL